MLAALHTDLDHEDDVARVARTYTGALILASAAHELTLIRKSLSDGK